MLNENYHDDQAKQPASPNRLPVGGVTTASYEQLYKLDKTVAAMVDGKPYGWGHFHSFVRFVQNQEYHGKTITDVVYMGNVGCINHLRLLYSCGYDLYEYTEDEGLMELCSRYGGNDLPRLQNIKITTYVGK